MHDRDASARSARDRHVVLRVDGDLDIVGATEALKRLLGLDLRRGDELVLDLSHVRFMDSTGVRLVLQARDHAVRHRAGFAVVRGPQAVMRVLELVGLEDQLEIVAAP